MLSASSTEVNVAHHPPDEKEKAGLNALLNCRLEIHRLNALLNYRLEIHHNAQFRGL